MKKAIILLSIMYMGACSPKSTKENAAEQVQSTVTDEHIGHDGDSMSVEGMSSHGMGSEKFHNPEHMTLDVDMIFQQQLKDLIVETTKLSSEFVTSDASKVKAQGEIVMVALNKVNRKLLYGQAEGLWLEGLMVIAHKLQTIKESDDIEVQREAFAVYSSSLFFCAKAFGIADQQVYYQYCPMAFDNKGAYWMSTTKEILNPYFGDKMLNCGSNKDGINVEI